MQARKANVQLIITVNAKGQPVYTKGVPALLGSSLSRLKNIVRDQAIHVEAAAHEAAKAVAAFEYQVYQLNLADDISTQLREAWLYDNAPDTAVEAEHWLIDYPGCPVNFFSGKPAFISRGFVSRIHIAEYFGMLPGPEVDQVGEGRITEELLAHSSYVLESTEWETLPFRKGGPTCARLRHRTYRHTSIEKSYPTVLSVDHSVSAVAAAVRSRNDDIARSSEPVVVKHILEPDTDGVNIDTPVKRSSVEPIDELTGLRKPNWLVG